MLQSLVYEFYVLHEVSIQCIMRILEKRYLLNLLAAVHGDLSSGVPEVFVMDRLAYLKCVAWAQERAGISGWRLRIPESMAAIRVIFTPPEKILSYSEIEEAAKENLKNLDFDSDKVDAQHQLFTIAAYHYLSGHSLELDWEKLMRMTWSDTLKTLKARAMVHSGVGSLYKFPTQSESS